MFGLLNSNKLINFLYYKIKICVYIKRLFNFNLKIIFSEFTEKYAVREKNKITYVIDTPMKPLELEKLIVHFEFNHPLGILNYAASTYEVSHWGNIAVEEKYQIENIGAKLEGEFGREVKMLLEI